MHATLEKLLKGDTAIVSFYQTAKGKWDGFFKTHERQPVDVWARWLTDEQITFFEHEFGGKSLGQEVMCWSGFAALYDSSEGFDNTLPLAEKLADAFAKSSCSLEVKAGAKHAAFFYALENR